MNTPAIHVRPMAVADHAAVNSILDELWGANALMLAQYRWHRGDWPVTPGLLRMTLVAERQRTVVGAATIFESTLHPALYIVLINVAPAWQGQGIGTALYDALAQRAADRPWMVKVSANDQRSIRFLERRGFRYATSSLIGVLDPASDSVQRWMHELPSDLSGVRIAALDEQDAPSRLALARMLYQLYAQYHRWNPPSDWTDERVLEIFLGPNTIVGSELWLLEGKTPIGAAVLFHEESLAQPDEAYLVHLGVLESQQRDVQPLTALLVRRELELAAMRRLRVRFEADDDYEPQRALYEAAPANQVSRELCVMRN